MKFNFTYQTSADGSSSMSSEQMKTFEMAGRIWRKYIQDDVIVNIHVASNDQLPDNVVGGALPGLVSASTYGHYSEFVNGLSGDITSEDDRIGTDNLKHGTMAQGLNLWRQQTYLTTANSKALALSSGSAGELDGVILMSDLSNLARNQDTNPGNDIGWGYYESEASTPYSLDFLSVVLHEIGHILGFVSGVDDEAWFQQVVETKALIDNDTLDIREQAGENTEIVYVDGDYNFGFDARKMPLDFFRYTESSTYWNQNDLSTGEEAYFSIDGGQTELANFSTSKYGNGDGYQASHWANAHSSLDIMAPTLRLDQTSTISKLDLRAFDVIGWDLADSLLGNDGTISQAELEQTLNLEHHQSLASLWQAASAYIDQHQSSLTRDRFDDVVQMIEKSAVYEGKKKKSNKASRKKKWQELWQEITDIFNTEASFSTFGSNDLEPPLHTKAVGTENDDELIGSGDRDKLIGKQGQDFLKGNGNDDLLKGGNHRDVLVGGAGADIFVIQDRKEFDVVRDFTDGEDALRLSGELTFDQLGITQKNNHTLIQQDDNLLMVLRNVDATTITIADFV
ncbi:MAG: NF038122 family metalloprotease [Cyanobacteria bacterium P01_F01_bin.150]